MGLGHALTIGLSAALAAYLGLWVLPSFANSEQTEPSDNTGDARLPSAVWMAPTLAGGGYSSEAISYALELDKEYGEGSGRFGLRQFAEQHNVHFVQGLPQATTQVLKRLMEVGGTWPASRGRPKKKRWDVAICHATPDVWHGDGAFGWGFANPCPPLDARYMVGRTMYETDRLPEKWVSRINDMDEVWVPSGFAVDQFVKSGVDREKIYVVPEAVDTALFDPNIHKPLELTGLELAGASKSNATQDPPFRFLSVFKWEKRKGWDLLLQAYFEEFSSSDAVELIVKTSAFHTTSDFEEKIKKLTSGLKSVKTPRPRYSLLSRDLPLRELPRLYRAVDAFVLPSRGEGWGRPHVEAMSMALPVIATNWSGSTEFLSERCALPLKIEGLREVGEHGPKGHKWAEPSVTHLRSLMRWVVEHPDEAKLIGQRAREEMLTRFSPEVVIREHVTPQLTRIAQRMKDKKKQRKEEKKRIKEESNRKSSGEL